LATTPAQKWAWVRYWLLPKCMPIQEPMNPATPSTGHLCVSGSCEFRQVDATPPPDLGDFAA
jgi:hypothetical protein